MHVQQVPWWRKALNFALTCIRSGFGLFAKASNEEMEPGAAGAIEEINKDNREEAELTKKSPEQIPTAEAPDVIVHPIQNPVEEPIPDLRSDVPIDRVNDRVREIATLEVELNAADPIAEPAEATVAVLVESETAPANIDEVEEELVDAIAEPIVESAHEASEITAPESAALEVTAKPIETALIAAEPGPAPVLEIQSLEPQLSVATEPQAELLPEQTRGFASTFENELVDEMAPQPESAISDVAVAEAVSPVLKSLADPAVQPEFEEASADPAKRSIQRHDEKLSREPEDPIVVDQAGQIIEPANEEKNDKMDIAKAVAEAAEAEQAIADQMDVNQTNPEPAEENVPPVETAAELALPITAQEDSVPTEEASAPTPAGSDEPEEPSKVAVAAQHPSKPFIKRESPEDQANASPFSVIVSQVYDGPLDLLLDLIRKQDIDIYDIPIARITAQFLAYVDKLKVTDVDVAGEFIYTASLLIHIKSKMLLPRAPSGPEDADEDPRRELVERLLEHERFKNAAQMLQQKQMLEAATWTNPGVRDFKEDAGAEPEIAADTVDLVRVFRDILDRARNRPVLNVEEDSVTVGQMIQFLSRRLNMEDKPVALRRLLSHTRSERALIAMFLALLELVRLQAILLRQDRAFSEIFIKKHTGFETVINQGVAQDDWK
jgi:segregation and condensation protein A